MRKWLNIVLLLLLAIRVSGQEMRIEDFKKQKKGILNFRHIVTDKKEAIIDLKTGEKGFTFLANGKTEAKAEEGEEMLSVKVPHKTTFITIKHPDYGQLTWKVPGKSLRKKKRYVATLLTFSPDKEYKLKKQWVVLDIQPRDAIVLVDSTTTTTRNGIVQLDLPLGSHKYRIESPFHEPEEGTIEVEDTGRITIPIALQPFYSYLTVKTPLKGGLISVDGKQIGETQATSGHLLEGSHRLVVMVGEQCYYDAPVEIGRAEKKFLELTMADLYPREVVSRHHQVSNAKNGAKSNKKSKAKSKTNSNPPELAMEQEMPAKTAPVIIRAANDSTKIWVDREMVGTGTWKGQLAIGFHSVSTEKEELESKTTYIWVDDETPQEIDLLAPMSNYGFLNVHCNEVGAEIYVNDTLVGVTPCIVEKLPAGLKCHVKLRKRGFRDAVKEVQVIGNDMVNVELKLRKKKKNEL